MPSLLLVPSHASSGRNRNVVQRLKTILHGRKPTAPDTHCDDIVSKNTEFIFHRKETHGRSFSAEIVGPTIQNNESTQVAPINALPVEILGEIFFFVSFSDIAPLYSPCIDPSSKTGPLLLCRICSYWRQIAIDTPLLWASIYIQNKPSPSLIKLWIERSQDLPFSFFWNFEERIDAVYRRYDYIGEVLPLLVAVMHRWRRMSFMDMDTRMIQELLKLSIPSSLPLEDILISYRFRGIEFADAIFKSLPTKALKRFAWHAESLHISLACEFWSRLTHVQIGTKINMTECQTILGHCLNAVEVYFGWVRGFEPPQRQSHSLLPRLKALRIPVADADVTLLLDRISCPNLRSLAFHSTSFKHESPARLRDFLTRSLCPMEEIVIGSYQMLEPSVMQLISMPVLHAVPAFVMFTGLITDNEQDRISTVLQVYKPTDYYIEDATEETIFKIPSKQVGWTKKSSECEEKRRRFL